MMERQGDSQVCMMIVDLDQFIPPTHLLRQVEGEAPVQGRRPPAEPVLLVKMWLIGYITSERRLEQEVNMNLAYRRFLGIPLDERVPDHSTLSNTVTVGSRTGRCSKTSLKGLSSCANKRVGFKAKPWLPIPPMLRRTS